MRRSFRALALVGSLAGCGGSSSGDPPQPEHGYQIKTPDIMLQAGDEKYVCYTVTLAEGADIAVTRFDGFTSAAVHHFEIFQTLAPEPAGLSDCGQQIIKQTWLPLFGGGANAGGLTLPAGAGFRLEKDAQLLLQLHLLNAKNESLTTHVVVNMEYAADASAVTRAGIYALGTMNINLQPGASGIVVGSHCTLGKSLDVFAVQPHMHTLGSKITLEHGHDQASAHTVYARDPWVFGAQPIDNFGMQMAAGDFIGTSCTFDNTTDHVVTYGESTQNEMCFFVLFYTPFDHLDGCIQ
jgi:hypothetical protein